MAQTQWDSFQELKENISMSDLLAHYGLLASLNPRRDGEKPYGVCLAIGSCLDSRPISGPQIFAALKSTLIGKGEPVPISRVLCLDR